MFEVNYWFFICFSLWVFHPFPANQRQIPQQSQPQVTQSICDFNPTTSQSSKMSGNQDRSTTTRGSAHNSTYHTSPIVSKSSTDRTARRSHETDRRKRDEHERDRRDKNTR